MHEDKNNTKPVDQTVAAPPPHPDSWIAPVPGPHPSLSYNSRIIADVPSTTPLPPKNKLIILIVAIVCLACVGGGLATYFLFRRPTQTVPSTNTETQEPTELEKSLSAEQVAALKSLNQTFYIPPDMQNTKVTMLANTAVPTTTYVATSINIRYGMGLERGAYIVYSYPLTDTFRPPQTCTPPEAVIRTNVACKEYKDSGEIKAYTSTGQLVPGIQNTTVQTYINMFAQIGNSVVLIQAADTDAATLYTMLANFKEVSPLELPKDSSITFVPPTIPAYMPVAKPETTTPTSTPSTNQSDLDPETEQRLNQELMDSIR